MGVLVTSLNFAAATGLPALRARGIRTELRGPVLAVCVAFLVAGCAFVIESVRFAQAQALEHRYAAQYARSEAAVADARRYYTVVRNLVEVDNAFRTASSSGSNRAAGIVQLAASLPEHAWLTQISTDANSTLVAGKSTGLAPLRRAFASMAMLPSEAGAQLLESKRSGDDDSQLEYRFRLGSSR